MPTAERTSASRGRSFGLYSLLVSVPLLVLLPMLMYSGVLLYLTARHSAEATERDLRASNTALATVLQNEFDQIQAMLNLVANSNAIGDGGIDAAATSSLLQGITRASRSLLAVTVLDRQGRVYAQYPSSPRTTLPLRPAHLRPAHLRAFSTGELVISDLDTDGVSPWASITVNQPVWQRGELRWVISAEISAPHLARLMQGQVSERGAVATLFDAQRRIVARTLHMERFVGRQPSREILAALNASPQGSRRMHTLEGQKLDWSWSHLPGPDWVLMVGSPTREADEALYRSIFNLALAGVLVLLLGVGATVLVARRIAGPVDRMAASASRLVRGETPPYQPSHVRQLDALYHALQDAGVVIAQALGDRDRALEAERVARIAADEDNRSKDEFIATLSHELRNPLSPIRAAAAVLKSPGLDPARHDWAVGVIERQSSTMAQLLEDLLDISRISSGRIELDRRPLRLAEVIAAAVETARPLIEQRHHQLTVRLPGRPVTLEADPLRLGQVFANLLTNAAKYTDPGGHIDVHATIEGAEVVVRVSDTGIGLEPAALEKVFQKFAQVRGPLDRSQGGLGLGLSLVRGIVKLHGGRVEARSQGLGQGSEFAVYLPLA